MALLCAVGFLEGPSVGKKLGSRLGTAEGRLDGRPAGVVEGSLDATTVGSSLGLGEGMALLCIDGNIERRSVGPEVVIEVGERLGR